MPNEFSRPVRLPSETFDRLFAGQDPAEVSRIAHATATALLARVRADEDPAAVDRLVNFANTHGIDDIAELWSQASPKSLPGALWRLYVVQRSIHADPKLWALIYERGQSELQSIDPVVAGAERPTGPREIVTLIDTILRGAFTGDFADALDRAAAGGRVAATGAAHLADDSDLTHPDRGTALTRRASRLAKLAAELTSAAVLWRTDNLR